MAFRATRTWALLIAMVVVTATGLFAYQARTGATAIQSCGDWVDATTDRVYIARQLLYPVERQEQTTGSLEGDAQALYDLAQEQASSQPPDEALNLNGDLVEAFSAGSNALGGGGGASPDAQVAFAKAIVYNADLRLAYLADGC